jgi:hypothetical protein
MEEEYPQDGSRTVPSVKVKITESIHNKQTNGESTPAVGIGGRN